MAGGKHSARSRQHRLETKRAKNGKKNGVGAQRSGVIGGTGSNIRRAPSQEDSNGVLDDSRFANASSMMSTIPSAQEELPSPYPSFQDLPQRHHGGRQHHCSLRGVDTSNGYRRDDSSTASTDGERTPLISNTRPSEYDATTSDSASTQDEDVLSGRTVPSHQQSRQHLYTLPRQSPSVPLPGDHYIPINGLPPKRWQERSTDPNSSQPWRRNSYIQRGSLNVSSEESQSAYVTSSSSSSSSSPLSLSPPLSHTPGSNEEIPVVQSASIRSDSVSTSTAKSVNSGGINRTHHTEVMDGEGNRQCHRSHRNGTDIDDTKNKVRQVENDGLSSGSGVQMCPYPLRWLLGAGCARNPENLNSIGGDKGHCSFFMPHCSDRAKCILAITLSCLALLLCSETLISRTFLRRRDAASEVFDPTGTAVNSLEKMEWEGRHLFDEEGRYRFVDYDQHPPFYSEFANTVAAGVYGKPLYSWYTNRGQAMAGFGVNCMPLSTPGNNRCDDILKMERTQDELYSMVPFHGFRTFLQFKSPEAAAASSTTSTAPSLFGRGDDPLPIGIQSSRIVEPFSPVTAATPSDGSNMQRNMYIGQGSSSIQLQEVDPYHGIETNVTYFTLPEEDFGAIVRRVQITNIDPLRSKVFGVLDGLARIEPAGDEDHSESQSGQGPILKVSYPYDDTYVMAYYQSVAQPSRSYRSADRETTKAAEDTNNSNERTSGAGNYCFSMVQQSSRGENTSPAMLPIIYDTASVFDQDTTLVRAQALESTSIKELTLQQVHGEIGKSDTASAFAALESVSLQPQQTVTITSIFGRAGEVLDVPVFARRIMQDGFVDFKLSRIRDLWSQLTAAVRTQNSSVLWNTFVSQMYLRNTLIGGQPMILGDSTILNDGTRTVDEDPRLKVYHLFSRSLDRQQTALPSVFFSESGGSLASTMDARRNDVIFNPRVGSFHIRSFVEFMQVDGTFPARIGSVLFKVKNPHLCAILAEQAVGQADGHRAQREALSRALERGPFRPSELFTVLEEHHIGLMISRQDFVDSVIASSDILLVADDDDGGGSNESEKGTAHDASNGSSGNAWKSLLGAINSYVTVFPDREEWLMFEEQLSYFVHGLGLYGCTKEYTYADTSQEQSDSPAVCSRCSIDDAYLGYGGNSQPYRIEYGTDYYRYAWQHDWYDRIFKSTIFEKLFLLATTHFARRDPYGVGLLDDVFGMPQCGESDGFDGEGSGRMRSDVSSMYQLRSLLVYLRNVLGRYPTTITLPVELSELIDEITEALETRDMFRNSTLGVTPRSSSTVPEYLINYWNSVSSALSTYLRRTQQAFRGWTIPFHPESIMDHLDRWIDDTDAGLERASQLGVSGSSGSGMEEANQLPPTYFTFQVVAWEVSSKAADGRETLIPRDVEIRPGPLFLDGPVHFIEAMTPEAAGSVFGRLRASSLFDDKLMTYRRCFDTSQDGSGCWEAGLSRPSPPFGSSSLSRLTHRLDTVSSTGMNYRLNLGLLRNGMYNELFDALLSGGMPPFVDPTLYGRPVIEPTQHVALSNVWNTKMVGRGLMSPGADLGTSDFLTLWIEMMVGPALFIIADDAEDAGRHLEMQLRPTIPIWMFSKADAADLPLSLASAFRRPGGGGASVRSDDVLHLQFMLFSSIEVHYYNERGTDLVHAVPSRYHVQLRDGTDFDVAAATIPGDLAVKVRRVNFVESIQVYFS